MCIRDRFYIWLQLDRLIRCKRINEGRIQTNLSTLPYADYRSRYVGLESTVTVTFQMTDKVELQVDLFLGNHISRRNIEECGLCTSILLCCECDQSDNKHS